MLYSLYWSGGAPARTRDASQPRGAGRAGPACPPSVRACVTRKKGPKGLQNHWNFITFIDKSEKVKTLLEGPESRLAKCPQKYWFAQGFRHEDTKKRFSSRPQKQRVKWSKKGSFFTFGELLSRNASILALKAE